MTQDIRDTPKPSKDPQTSSAPSKQVKTAELSKDFIDALLHEDQERAEKRDQKP